MEVGDLVTYHGEFIDSCLCRLRNTHFRVLKIREDTQKVKCSPLGVKGYFWFDLSEVKKITIYF